ncbi:MAG: MmcQ/YjbR family DNA-binding protein [Vicinamibacterales bacterium]|nr:MmcQ/YjbR family DNA-binding protein [Vicinamibacterales bacterium]
MNHESVREHCLALPFVTEIVRWGENLLFKVGGKMFAILDLEAERCSVKCSHEAYAELVEREDIVPASHNMWRNQWVRIESLSALPDREFRALLTAAYGIVRAGLPRKIRAELDAGRPAAIKPWVPRPRRSAARRQAR